jgi:hypothetical protein
MWDAGDDDGGTHATTSKSSGFTLDDAFSEDDEILDAALEFNPATIRAALARTLAAEEFESTESRNGVEDGGGSTGAGVSDPNSNHDRNGSVKMDDPDASVSTLDINAPPVRAPGRATGEWSRSTSYSHGYGYRQDSQDDASGVNSLANFSRISLSDSAHDLESVEVFLEPSEETVEEGRDEEAVTEEDHEGLFRAVRIDLSQGGKPLVEEFAAILPASSGPPTPDREEMRIPSPNLSPSPHSSSNGGHSTYASPPTSTPTSNAFQNNQSQSRSVPELPPQTTYPSSAETNHIPPDSVNIVLSSSSLGNASSTRTSESIPTPNSATFPPNLSQSELSRHDGHRHSRSIGPSTLDKVISRTRPTFLPPKPKTEDLKHLADWEAMMKQSRVVGEFSFLLVHLLPVLLLFSMLLEGSSILTFSSLPPHPKCISLDFGFIEKQKRKVAEERRLARETRAEEAVHIWEKQILPDWRVVHKNPELRKLWWQGVPTSMRGKMWENAVGNPLSLSKGDASVQVRASVY